MISKKKTAKLQNCKTKDEIERDGGKRRIGQREERVYRNKLARLEKHANLNSPTMTVIGLRFVLQNLSNKTFCKLLLNDCN